MEGHSKAAEILLIEDNPGDVELIREALQSGKLLNHISVSVDGEQAMEFLNRQNGYAAAPRPDLIMLDLNLPKKNGFEVLEEIRAQPRLSRIPVIILTSSQADRDILKGYDLHANCFISKPVEVEEFLTVVRSTGEFWLTLVKLPG
jgi:CheY-like chemotaxis protein